MVWKLFLADWKLMFITTLTLNEFLLWYNWDEWSEFFNGICSAAGLWKVVQRTKQCLDFSATVHILHLLACWFYAGHIPVLPSLYLLHLLTLALMCVMGEYLCLRSEMSTIPVRAMPPKADLWSQISVSHFFNCMKKNLLHCVDKYLL